jgi:predicted acyltransferase
VLALLRWQDGAGADGAPAWISPLPWAYQRIFADIGADPRLGSLLFALANLSVYWLLAWALDRRRIYIRV